MKKIIFLLVFTFVMALPLATTTQAATTPAPDGFYLLEEGEPYVPVNKFLYSNLQQKVALLTGNYYLILEGSAIKSSDILLSTDKEVMSKLTTQAELEDKFNVKIDAQGKVQEPSTFSVLSID
ncbi:hypothetical protein CSV69_10165 [Sporosarcina sp. P26b]|uniref:hypothetical protein n=1 Tax=Sporosarcina sp. P26b TaxID=2048253 RepID=UPI000C166FEB|nr:hypothetical protein [Sporosarcina sp. P26b]PIC95695.1 hypothetical protein CSV69_10165 [Sporosarcina sp. P26b]